MINAGYLSDSTRNELFEQFKELSELLRETSEIIEGIAYTFYNSDEETDEDESDETVVLLKARCHEAGDITENIQL